MIKQSGTLVTFVVGTGLLFAPGTRMSWAGQAGGEDINSEIESVRADLRAGKVAVITQTMQFTPQESSAFWPIYKKYEADLTTLNDQRVQLIKDYAEQYEHMTDAQAKTLAEKEFKFESDRIDLKRKYFKEFNNALPATTVVKYFQLEHRLDLLLDLKIASMLPSLFEKTVTAQGASH